LGLGEDPSELGLEKRPIRVGSCAGHIVIGSCAEPTALGPTQDLVASRPNVGLGVDVSRANMEVDLDAVASRPNVGLGADVSTPNMEVDLNASMPNQVVGRGACPDPSWVVFGSWTDPSGLGRCLNPGGGVDAQSHRGGVLDRTKQAWGLGSWPDPRG
jgi:hypothetical protein